MRVLYEEQKQGHFTSIKKRCLLHFLVMFLQQCLLVVNVKITAFYFNQIECWVKLIFIRSGELVTEADRLKSETLVQNDYIHVCGIFINDRFFFNFLPCKAAGLETVVLHNGSAQSDNKKLSLIMSIPSIYTIRRALVQKWSCFSPLCWPRG